MTTNNLGKLSKVPGCKGLGARGYKGRRYLHGGFCTRHHERLRLYGDVNAVKQVMDEHRRKHPLYETYRRMKARCYYEKGRSYKNYGGRGIKVCERWLGVYGFTNFCIDMGERPEGLTLDRTDNNGNYEQSNCRWATRSQQAFNRRKKGEIIMSRKAAGLK